MSGSYGTPIDVGNVTTYTVTGLTDGETYFFAVTAYGSAPNESGYSNEVSYTVPGSPKIVVLGNATAIADGDTTPASTDHTDFGSVCIGGTPVMRTFTIRNTGDSQLTLSGTPQVAVSGADGADFTLTAPLVAVSGANAAEFTVTAPPAPSIAAGASTSFTVGFNPGAAGTRLATVSIANNDADKSPYDFAIQGTGAAIPEISLLGDGALFADGTATENPSTTGKYRISRTGSTASSLTVYFSLSGTATRGTDYHSIASPRTIPAGATSVDVALTPIDDGYCEPDETAILTLTANAAYTIGSPASATIVIQSDDARPTVTVAATDNLATEAGPMTGTYRITRSGGSTISPLPVYFTMSGTSYWADYASLRSPRTIPAGATSVDVALTPIDDGYCEPDETAILTLAANAAYIVGTPGDAAVTIASEDVGEIILDNVPAGQRGDGCSHTGSWAPSSAASYYGVDSLYSNGSGTDTYRWTPTIPAAGSYEVHVRWTAYATRSTAVPIAVTHAGGTTTKTYNEQAGGGLWVLHGTYSFNAGTAGYVQVSDLNGQASADAVKFVPVSSPPPEIILDNVPAGQSGDGCSYSGTWAPSGAASSYGVDSLYSNGSGTDTYRWTPTIPAAGSYEVYVRWTAYATRSTTVLIAVTHAGGTTTKTYNERTGGSLWVLHGTYSFNAGTAGYVQVSDLNGQASADAVRFVPLQ